jgi:hypothetical protein
MNVNLFPFAVLWMFLAVVVVGLIVYRKWIAKDEDDTLHVMENEASLVAQQAVMAEKLATIDLGERRSPSSPWCMDSPWVSFTYTGPGSLRITYSGKSKHEPQRSSLSG